MTYPNDNYSNTRRNSTAGWVIGAIAVIAVIAAIFLYNSGNNTTASNETKTPAKTTDTTSTPTTTGSTGGSPASAPSAAPTNPGAATK